MALLIACMPCPFPCSFAQASEASLSPRPGFFQTGLTTAVECDVLLADGSACRGGEACVAGGPACHGRFGNSCGPGSEGMLCGACPRGWARDSYPEACQPCPPESVSVLIASLTHITWGYLGVMSPRLKRLTMVAGAENV